MEEKFRNMETMTTEQLGELRERIEQEARHRAQHTGDGGQYIAQHGALDTLSDDAVSRLGAEEFRARALPFESGELYVAVRRELAIRKRGRRVGDG